MRAADPPARDDVGGGARSRQQFAASAGRFGASGVDFFSRGGRMSAIGVLSRHALATGNLAVDAHGRVIEADWTDGAEPAAGPGVRLSTLIHPADRPALAALVLGAVTSGSPTRRLLHVLLDTQYVPALVTIDDRLDELGVFQIRVFGLASAAFDLEALAELAFWDPLTQLANRVLFAEHLRTEFQRCARSGRGLAVLVADVNGLKRVNDDYGHQAGDSLLAEVGRRLAASCRPSDTAARLSGDEFAVLCPEVDTEDTARELAGRLAAGVSGPMQLAGGQLDVQVAFGWAVSTEADLADNGADLLHRADLCMYGAKRFMPGTAERHSGTGP
jgi:diguanylate cyclase (GGDEF)-like protein